MRLIDLFRNRVASLRGLESGKRIFILANGPSVANLDLSFLNKEVVIGMNASSMLEEKNNFKSNYYVISDHRFLASAEKRVWGTSKLDPSTVRVLRKELELQDDVTIKNKSFYVPALTRDGFSKNLSHGFHYGCTTTLLALQLAWHLGSREVFLLGCDLRYPDENPRFYTETIPQVEDSFISVQISNIVNAAVQFEAVGGKLTNCSASSFLRPYLPYSDLNSLLLTLKTLEPAVQKLPRNRSIRKRTSS